MGVVMKGGNSGNREDALPSVPSADGEYTYPARAASLPSTVIMKGGTSGDGNSYLPNVNVAFSRQEPQDTDKNASFPNVKLSYCSGNRGGDQDPPVPNSATPDDSAA